MTRVASRVPGLLAAVLLAVGIVSGGGAELPAAAPAPGTAPAIDPSLAREAQAAIARAFKWLAANQGEDGSWSNKEFPALTALPLWAFAQNKPQDAAVVDKAVKFILSCVRENGGIYREVAGQKGGGLANYNTAICMAALHAVGKPSLVPTVQKARAYVAGTQHMGGDVYQGGMGYDPETGRPYSDLSNTYIAYEAMRLTESVETLRGEGQSRADLNWDAALKFLGRLQHRKASNDQQWVSDEPDEQGGFIYRPDASQAGTAEKKDGTVTFRAYGSMTYAGLLSLIYANAPKDDPRVQSAFDWAARHWSLEENPGMGKEGLYYFYNVMAKALARYDHNPIARPDGTSVDWRTELVRKLVSLQKIDPKTGAGYWLNEAGRWWEADPVLVTSYSILALQAALGPM